MCGICGKLSFTGAEVEEDLIRAMNSTLVHRGPDDQGIYVKGNVGLGHRRLSIIDLSPAGRQPMSNEDGTIWIVFNGEIYNFLTLREGLEKKGHKFRSNSDTEVIIHLYEEEGAECVKKLRGMFAFGIWDEKKNLFFMARDRIGKKPLFYFLDDKTLVFASEIKAILQDQEIDTKPDYTAIHHYLTFQSVPSPYSAFEGIRKLPPAHYLLCRNGQAEISQYWNLNYFPKFEISGRTSIVDLEVELIYRLREAVKLRLISDVPLGVFLSGGLDSSAIVALMSEVSDRPVSTFSIGFKEEIYNELDYARIISNQFGTIHKEFIVEPNVAEVIPKLVWHYNEPFADASAIPSFYVSQIAKEHVTVALNGDGGDESFAGYERHAAGRISDALNSILPRRALSFLLQLVKFFPHRKDSLSILWKIKRLIQETSFEKGTRNARWLSHFMPEQKMLIYSESFSSHFSSLDSFALIYEKYNQAISDSFIEKVLYADVSMYLPDTLLVKTDIASMANSLEVRSPFLDHEFMEFSAKIPAQLKLKGLTSKYILKRALKDILPREIISRRKRGFSVPLEYWFRNELKEMAYDVILGERAISRGYFKKEAVRKLLDEHAAGVWNWQYQIWNLLMLELWHREFIDSK